MNTNKTSLEWISELALRLTTIAHDPETWEDYKTVETDTKGVVIDRTENNLSRYVRECEIHFSALYDETHKLEIENHRLRKELQSVVDKARNSQQSGQILIAMMIEEVLSK